jgi:hypothetical protein
MIQIIDKEISLVNGGNVCACICDPKVQISSFVGDIFYSVAKAALGHVFDTIDTRRAQQYCNTVNNCIGVAESMNHCIDACSKLNRKYDTCHTGHDDELDSWCSLL